MAKKKPINNDTMLSFRAPSGLVEEYRKLSDRLGVPASKLQRQALIEFLNKEKEGVKENGNTESL